MNVAMPRSRKPAITGPAAGPRPESTGMRMTDPKTALPTHTVALRIWMIR